MDSRVRFGTGSGKLLIKVPQTWLQTIRGDLWQGNLFIGAPSLSSVFCLAAFMIQLLAGSARLGSAQLKSRKTCQRFVLVKRPSLQRQPLFSSSLPGISLFASGMRSSWNQNWISSRYIQSAPNHKLTQISALVNPNGAEI